MTGSDFPFTLESFIDSATENGFIVDIVSLKEIIVSDFVIPWELIHIFIEDGMNSIIRKFLDSISTT